jgi:hypothetical protein
MDLHRTFAEVMVWEDGRLRHAGRVDMTRSGLEGFARSLQKSDEVVIEATGNAMVVSHLLTPRVARVVIANPIQVKAIAHAHVKTDKIDAGVLANLYAAGYLPEVWTPDEGTERLRRLVARRNQVVRHRTRLKNETHGILHATSRRGALMPTSSAGLGGPGWSARCCRMMSISPSAATCGSSTAWARIWPSSIARLARRPSTAWRCAGC